jgi:hypothetical protein
MFHFFWGIDERRRKKSVRLSHKTTTTTTTMNEDDIWHCVRCETLLFGIVGDFVPMNGGGGVCCITCNTQRCCETDAFQNVPAKKDDEAVALISEAEVEAEADAEADAEAEAQRRNQALVHQHGRIPSYSCWDSRSVGPPEAWLQWWWTDFTETQEGSI